MSSTKCISSVLAQLLFEFFFGGSHKYLTNYAHNTLRYELWCSCKVSIISLKTKKIEILLHLLLKLPSTKFHEKYVQQFLNCLMCTDRCRCIVGAILKHVLWPMNMSENDYITPGLNILTWD